MVSKRQACAAEATRSHHDENQAAEQLYMHHALVLIGSWKRRRRTIGNSVPSQFSISENLAHSLISAAFNRIKRRQSRSPSACRDVIFA